jgi:hypothetical protein
MEQWAILKTLSGSSPIFALSIHTTFSQTQTGATVPLRQLIRRSKPSYNKYISDGARNCNVTKTMERNGPRLFLPIS